MKYWKTILTMLLMVAAILFKWNWIWAIFVTMSLYYIFITDEIHIVETIRHKDSPRMYWLVFGFLVLFDVVLILTYLGVIII